MTKKTDSAEAQPKQSLNQHSPQLDAMQVTGVQVGGSSTANKKATTKRLKVSGASLRSVVIVLALLVIAYLGVNHFNTNSRNKKQASKPVAVPYAQQLASELQAAQSKVAKENTSSKTSKKQKFDNYLALAAAYMNEDKPVEAIKAYQDALTTDPSAKTKVLNGLMYAYSANGQQAEAISTGEELLALLNAQKSSSESLANDVYISSVTNDLNTLKSGAKL